MSAVVGKQKAIPVINIPNFVLEGGSVNVDGAATLMACQNSIISENRNTGITIQQAEKLLSQYLGISNFIWIDGMARYLDDHIIMTVSKKDFKYLYEGINIDDYDTFLNATNGNGESYEIVNISLTKSNVLGLDYKGSYLNFYVGNTCTYI